MRASPAASACAFLLLLAIPSAEARVFLRTGGAGSGIVDPGAFGWDTAYQTSMSINGGRAELATWSAPEALSTAVKRLREACQRRNVAALFFASGDLAWGLASGDGRVVRFLLTASGGGRQSLVFAVDQSADDYRLSAQRPTSHLLREVPPFPQSTPDLYVADDGTATAVEISRSPVEPQQIRAHYESALPAAGWALAPPQRVGSASAAVYVKDNQLCVLLIKSTGFDGGSVITLMHKRQNLAAPP